MKPDDIKTVKVIVGWLFIGIGVAMMIVLGLKESFASFSEIIGTGVVSAILIISGAIVLGKNVEW